MKKHLILAFTAMTLFACNTEELETVDENLNTPPDQFVEVIDGDEFKNTNDPNVNPRQFPNPLNDFEPNQLGSKGNPIAIDDTDFIEGVTYNIQDCSQDITYSTKYDNGRLEYTVSTGVSTFQRTLDIQPSGCGIPNDPGNSTIEGPIFQSGFYYTLRGELLRLGDFPESPFSTRRFFKEEEGTDQVRFATIFPADVNSNITFGDLTRTPIPDVFLSCRGVQPLREGAGRVVSNPVDGEYYVENLGTNFLLQYDGNNRIFVTINRCGLEPDDNCAGIDEWVRGTRYSVGNQVVYRNYLFTKLLFGWEREGKCD